MQDNETDTFIPVKSKSLSQNAESLVWCEPLLLPFPFFENMNGQSSFDATVILRRFLRIKLCLTLYMTEGSTVTTLGKALIDPALFAYGMPSIEGWYDITDKLQCTLGQLKLSLSLTSSPGNYCRSQ